MAQGALQIFRYRRFQGPDPAHPRRPRDTESGDVDRLQGRIVECFLGGMKSQLDKSVDLFDLFFLDDDLGTESLHFRGDCAGKVVMGAKGHRRYAAASLHDHLKGVPVMPQGVDHPHTGNDDAFHWNSSLKVSKTRSAQASISVPV